MLEEKIDDINLHSEEVQYVIGRPPKNIVMYGNIIILLIALVVVACTFIIRVPKTLTIPVKISSTPPSVELLSNMSGTITQIICADGEEIKAGDTILCLSAFSTRSELIKLKKDFIALDNPMVTKEWMEAYQSVLHVKSKVVDSDITSLIRLLDKYRVNIQMGLDKKDKIYDEIHEKILVIRRQLKTSYVITAPTDGRLFYFKLLEPGSYLKKGAAFAQIVPSLSSYVSYASVSSDDLRKLHVHQKGIIELDGFTGEQDRQLDASINYIASIPYHSKYFIRLGLATKSIAIIKSKNLPEYDGKLKILTSNETIFNSIF